MTTFKKAVVEIGSKYIGGGNNRVFFRDWKVYDNYCAAGTTYVLEKALEKTNLPFPELDFHRSVRVRGVTELYSSYGALHDMNEVRNGKYSPQIGDIIIWKSSVHSSHVALVTSYDSQTDKFEVVNFNWAEKVSDKPVSGKNIAYVGSTLFVSNVQKEMDGIMLAQSLSKMVSSKGGNKKPTPLTPIQVATIEEAHKQIMKERPYKVELPR